MATPHSTFASAGPATLTVAPVSPTAAAPRRRWFRKKRVLLPMLALMVALSVGGVYAWKIDQAFQAVNAISTPPPVLAGSALGGEESVSVDTGPAQAAMQTYEAEQHNQVALASTQTPEPTQSAAETPEPTQTPAPDEPVSNLGTQAEPTGEPRIPANTDRAAAGEPEPTIDAEATVTSDPDASEPSGTHEPETDALSILPSPTSETATADATESEAITILLMGVDARDGEAIDVGVRPDSLAVLRLDPETKSCRMLQIPRDSRVELPGYGRSKINHALAVGGIPYEIQVVEQYLDMEIDHYGLVDFGAVVSVIDQVGGVTVDNPRAFEAQGVSFPEGVQTLGGEDALTYSRFRSDEQGDFGRMSRQQEILRAILAKVSPSDVPGMLPGTLPMLEKHFRTDMDATALAGLAQDHTWCTADVLETDSLGGNVAMYPDPLLDMELSYVIIDESERTRGRDWLLGS